MNKTLLTALSLSILSSLGAAAPAFAYGQIVPGQAVLHVTDNTILGPVLQVYSNGMVLVRHDYPSSYCGGASGCHHDDLIPERELSPETTCVGRVCQGQKVMRVSDRVVLNPVLKTFTNGMVLSRHDYPVSYCGGAAGCHKDELNSYGDLSPETSCIGGICEGQLNVVTRSGMVLTQILLVFENGMATARHDLPRSYCGGALGCHEDIWVEVSELGVPINPGYPAPGHPSPGYPAPRPHPVVCTTESRGRNFSIPGQDEYVTRAKVIAVCRQNGFTDPRECELNAHCR